MYSHKYCLKKLKKDKMNAMIFHNRRYNIIKRATHPKFIYRIDVIHNRIPADFLRI